MNLRQVAQHALKVMDDHMYRADTHEFYEAKEALRAALAEPEQEPVAEIVQAFADLKAVSFGAEMPPVGTKLYTALTPQPEQPHDLLCLCGAEWDIYSDGREELVAAPQWRKPLTDEQILKICQSFRLGYTDQDLARAIERAHGIGEQT